MHWIHFSLHYKTTMHCAAEQHMYSIAVCSKCNAVKCWINDLLEDLTRRLRREEGESEKATFLIGDLGWTDTAASAAGVHQIMNMVIVVIKIIAMTIMIVVMIERINWGQTDPVLGFQRKLSLENRDCDNFWCWNWCSLMHWKCCGTVKLGWAEIEMEKKANLTCNSASS